MITGACTVSASLSSLIALSAGQSGAGAGAAVEPPVDVPADLLSALRLVTDPRCRRGVRHQLVSVLGLAVCAVLAGARSYVA
ncbi:MAG: transposase family protein, partial [Mycobacteriales bacterium]